MEERRESKNENKHQNNTQIQIMKNKTNQNRGVGEHNSRLGETLFHIIIIIKFK